MLCSARYGRIPITSDWGEVQGLLCSLWTSYCCCCWWLWFKTTSTHLISKVDTGACLDCGRDQLKSCKPWKVGRDAFLLSVVVCADLNSALPASLCTTMHEETQNLSKPVTNMISWQYLLNFLIVIKSTSSWNHSTGFQTFILNQQIININAMEHWVQ